MGERLVQEAFVGYKYGTYFKVGLVCEHTPISAYQNGEEEKKEDQMEVDEQSSVPAVADPLAKFNLDKFLNQV